MSQYQNPNGNRRKKSNNSNHKRNHNTNSRNCNYNNRNYDDRPRRSSRDYYEDDEYVSYTTRKNQINANYNGVSLNVDIPSFLNGFKKAKREREIEKAKKLLEEENQNFQCNRRVSNKNKRPKFEEEPDKEEFDEEMEEDDFLEDEEEPDDDF